MRTVWGTHICILLLIIRSMEQPTTHYYPRGDSDRVRKRLAATPHNTAYRLVLGQSRRQGEQNCVGPNTHEHTGRREEAESPKRGASTQRGTGKARGCKGGRRTGHAITEQSVSRRQGPLREPPPERSLDHHYHQHQHTHTHTHPQRRAAAATKPARCLANVSQSPARLEGNTAEGALLKATPLPLLENRSHLLIERKG